MVLNAPLLYLPIRIGNTNRIRNGTRNRIGNTATVRDKLWSNDRLNLLKPLGMVPRKGSTHARKSQIVGEAISSAFGNNK